MHSFCLRVHGWHFARELVVDPVLDRNPAEIRVFAIEAAFRRLVCVLEPAVADERPAMQRPSDVAAETGRTLGLGRHLRPGSIGIGQSDKAGLADRSIGVEGGGWLRVVTIERDNIEVPARSFDHRLRRRNGKATAEHEVVRVGGLDGSGGQREVAIRHQSGKGLC